MSDSSRFRVAYLVNRYPAISHTFIRREIAGVERCGIEVRRFSIRPTEASGSIDEADRAEQQRTTVLLAGGVLPLLANLAVAALGRPLKFLRALSAAWRLGGRSGKAGRLRHLAYLAEACLLRRILARDSVDHLHAHFGTNPAAVALLCRLLGGPPYSFTVHGPEEFDRPDNLSLPEKIRHAAFVVAISNYGRGQLMRWTDPAGWPKLHVVRCGVDSGYFGEVPATGEDGRLVCVGRLCEDKGQLLLVEAAGRLLRDGRRFELALVGDGAIRATLDARIRELGLEKCVTVKGWMDGEGVRKEIARSRALVLPSFAEGLPVVIMEALALRRPVLSTYVAGIPELVRPGLNGWLVPSGSVDDLAAALRDVLEAPAERLESFGRDGREAVRERHDADREAKRLSEHFRNAVSRSRPS
jgi:glycosyltransferase involved in cell wall biosynthesis